MGLIYDERPGMVAVYEGPRRDCLEMPADTFVFLRYWPRGEEGAFIRNAADCTVAKLISGGPAMLEALQHAEGLMRAAGGIFVGAADMASLAIQKAQNGAEE